MSSRDAVTLAGLRPGSVKSSVYWTVRAHTLGLTRAAIDAALPWLLPKSIENALFSLMLSHLVAQPEGRGTRYLVDDTCGASPEDVDVLATVGMTLLDLVVDCDAGMSVRVLAGELGLCDSEVHAALMPALASGQVERFDMGDRQGPMGGMGYRPTQHLLAQIAQAASIGVGQQGAGRVVVLDIVDSVVATQPGAAS